ncbi:hypothetical protein [Xanthomonas tesorieronis]|uniref:hypothetical protein n=1 Tax=Xanthomonas tesorieronis TaxID=3160839 RepID=UPI0035131D1C
MEFTTAKPKLFWMAAFIIAFSLIILVPLLLFLNYFEYASLWIFVYVFFIISWAAIFVSIMCYFVRQAQGKYAKIKPRPLKDQIW